ncbi:MAG: Holliday junction branch migration DNA helicase RuvB, partial [Acidobacteria bacterium]|nr:Holliday junction branch migration DNA helicase RuvB [Acidobacteriota bacterium]
FQRVAVGAVLGLGVLLGVASHGVERRGAEPERAVDPLRGLEGSGADEIARRSRGTPRIANRLLRRVRDFAQVEEDGRITSALAELYLERLEVDRYGLDETDRRLLMTIHEKFEGGPVGLNTLAAAIGEETDTLEEIYEPYLLQIGFLDRTSRGRMITRRARTHLKISPTRDGGTPQSPLF